MLFLAKSKDDAFDLANDLVDICEDINHDGSGDLFKSKGVGIHDLHELYATEDSIIKNIYRDNWISLGSINVDSLISDRTPKIRKKKELAIYNQSQNFGL